MINSDFRNIIMNNLILSGFPATKIQNLIENLLIMFKRQTDVLQLLLSPLANRIKTNLTAMPFDLGQCKKSWYSEQAEGMNQYDVMKPKQKIYIQPVKRMLQFESSLPG